MYISMVGDRNKFLYNKVLQYRKAGKSYGQISKELKVPKSTLNNWLSGKEWSDKITLKLVEQNRKSSYEALIKFSHLRHLATLEKYKKYRIQALKEYNRLKSKKLFLVGIAVYWAEGEKLEKGRVALINSDVNMIKLVADFYRYILKIPEEKLRAALFIYEDINEQEAIEYWSSNINLNKKQFIKTQVLPSRSTRTKTKLRYGMCNIYFSSVEVNIKMKEWIDILAKDLRV